MSVNGMIKRLRKGDWNKAVIYARGHQPIMVGDANEDRKFIVIDDTVQISAETVENPFFPPAREGEQPFLATVEVYIHEEEIGRVDFYKFETPKERVKSIIT